MGYRLRLGVKRVTLDRARYRRASSHRPCHRGTRQPTSRIAERPSQASRSKRLAKRGGSSLLDKPPMAPGRMPAEPLRPLRRTPSGSHATASVLVFGGLVRGSRHRGACLRGAVFRTRNGPWSRPLPPRSLPAWSNVRLPSREVAPKIENTIPPGQAGPVM